MLEIARFMMLIQMPVIISIIVMGLQAVSLIAEHKLSFRFILAGWFGNLLYICLKFSAGSYIGPVIAIEALSTMADLVSAYCFYLAGAVFFKDKESFGQIKNSLVAAVFIGAGIFKVNTIGSPVYIFGVMNVGNLLTVLCDFYALLILARLFNELTKEYPSSKILFIGALIYSLVQLLDLFSYDFGFNTPVVKYVNDAGFVLGFICKFLILFGFSVLTVQTVKHSSRLEAELETSTKNEKRMRAILGRTFHEVNPPLLAIENSLSTLSSDTLREDGIIYNKKTAREIEIIEQALFRTKTILAASVKIYLSEESRLTQDDNYSELPFQIEEKRDVNNLNTLIEVAVINFKSKLLTEHASNDFENNRIKFHTQYGANCNLYCSSVQMVQIFYNLFKNSLEAISGQERICNIHIKTKLEKIRVEKNEEPDSPADSTWLKRIHVEVRDDGPGIDREILPKIFELGFSTKDTKETIKGYGLDIVKTFTESNKGKVEVLSNNSTEDITKSGVTFIFQFEVN
jgi:signal transduction histidine kinase